MARIQKTVVIFPSRPDLKHSPAREDAEGRGSYFEYLLDLADRLLGRPVDDDGSQAA